MKAFLSALIRYTFAGILIAICVVCFFGILAYYQTATALVPAAIGGVSFFGAIALTIKD